MARSNQCLITVGTAKALRELAKAAGLEVPKGKLKFKCPECKKVVQPIGNHFEHIDRNARCSLSAPARS